MAIILLASEVPLDLAEFFEPLTTSRAKSDVFTQPTQPTPMAHFATYPEKLIEPMILAGTSAFGCCSTCGAPYERVVERVVERGTQPSQSRANLKPPQQSGIQTSTETNGWRPTCKCGATTVVPPRVLDPFVGSGTTIEVCERLGRSGVGVDLAYQDLSTKRTAQRGLQFLAGDV